jgi:SAM-dependent methyltransferase
LEVIRASHRDLVNVHEANVFRFLRAAAARGDTFDLIYTLGLTDYLDTRAMQLLHRLMLACLAPGGRILLANFLPSHLAVGWMDAVMDWHLIYRDDDELMGYADEISLSARTWRDPTGSVVWCQMQ